MTRREGRRPYMTKTEQFLIEHGHDAAPLYFEVSTATVPLAAQALGVEAVSYTHLDVYKRQSYD